MANKKSGRKTAVKKNNKVVKSDKKKIEEVKGFDSEKTTNILLVTVAILLVFSVFYGITIFITRESRETAEEEEVNISYYKILLGSSFDKSGEYYVIYYDATDEEISSTYSSLVGTYRSKGELSIYDVDMGNALNKSYASEDANREATKADELKINGPTLIKFSDGKIVEYYEGETEINEVLS